MESASWSKKRAVGALPFFIRHKQQQNAGKINTMYHFNSGAWRWIFLTPPADVSFFTDPETMSRESLIVKNHPDVLVFKYENMFFKWEKSRKKTFSAAVKARLRPRAYREFKTLCRLAAAGLTVTAPIGCGICKKGSILITRSEDNAVPVWSYFCDQFEQKKSIPEEFLDIWGRFIGNFIAAGFYSADFHAGNLLFNESEKRFILVDVYGTQKSLFRTAEKKVMRMIFRQLKDVSCFMSQEMIDRVLDGINAAGCRINKESFPAFCTASVREFLPRRMKNFDPELSLVRRPDGKTWNIETEEIKGEKSAVEKLRKTNFLLNLYGIPHLLATGYSDNTVSREKINGPASEECSASLRKRLEAAGFRSEDFFFCLNSVNMPVAADKIFISHTQEHM